MKNWLIGTKLQIPPMTSRMLSRDHLLDRLSTPKNSRLFVISGVAGSGKTALVCQWIKKNKVNVAWYSLDETDNDSDVFFRYLLAALSSVDNHLASKAGEWVHSQEKLSGTDIIPLLIQCLIDLPKDIYLVLDDYHLITSKEIHDSLYYLLNHMPSKMHIVVISRYSLPFSLARFEVRNQLIKISAEDMRFSEEETVRFFAEIMPAKLSTEQAHEFNLYMEGWAGGLRLLGLCFKGKEGPHGLDDILNRALDETTGYLIDEVINTQPKKIRHFLYETAFLGRFSAELCRNITSLSDIQGVLDYIYNKNLFLTPLDPEHTWYRYHNLFSEALRRRARQSYPNIVRDVNRKAALWFSRNSYLEDAFQHAFASEDYEFASDLLEDHIFLLHERYEIALALRWIDKLPPEAYAQHTLLRLYDCALRIGSLDVSRVEAVILDIESHRTSAFERYKGSKRMLCHHLFMYLINALPYYRNIENFDVSQLNQAFQKSSLEDKLYVSLMPSWITAEYYLLQANLAQATDTLGKMQRIVFSSHSVLARIHWFKQMATAERWQGHLRRSENVISDALKYLNQEGLSDTPLASILYVPMSYIFYFRNQLDEALEYAANALKYAEQTQTAIGIIEGNTLLSLIHGARGDFEAAALSVQQMQSAARTTRSLTMVRFADCTMAFLYMAFGDMRRAEEWTVPGNLDLNQQPSLPFLFEGMAHTRLLYMHGRYREAWQTLGPVREHCLSQNMLEIMLDADLLGSAVLWALDDRDQAIKIMENGLAFSEREGYIRQFINHTAIIFPILKRMAEITPNGEKSSYLMTILKACGIDGKDTGAGKNRNAYLSPREMQILELMASGYSSYSQIAEKVFVSLDTIRTHTKHIYKKLSVNNRDQAIRRAQELKLINIQKQRTPTELH